MNNMDPTQTIDLSKFPKIIPPVESKEEIEKRSTAITNISNLMEGLKKAMEAYVSDLLVFDSKVKSLALQQDNLKEIEYANLEKEKKLFIKEEELKKEKEYITSANLSLKERESKVESDHNYVEEIRIEKQEWEDRKSEAIRQEQLLDKKIKSKEEMDKLLVSLEEREAVVTRSEAIDVERKRLLDLREERIHAKEVRLRIDSQE